jgi:hypothetical protein
MQLLGPPAFDRLPVGAVPALSSKAVKAAVIDAIEDEGFGTREQSCFHRHFSVSFNPPIADEAFVAFAGFGGDSSVDGSTGYAEVAEALGFVQDARKEHVHLGYWGEASLVWDVVRGAQGNQVRNAAVAGVAASTVGRIPT